MAHLLIFGLGFCGAAVARAALATGMEVTAAIRAPDRVAGFQGISIVGFEAASAAIGVATHLVATAPPGQQGDPVLARYGATIREAQALHWIGYLSTTGVYGDRQGGWVDEDTEPAPASDRARRRVAAEDAWRDEAAGRPLDIFRLAGIYGPGRSPFEDLRTGRARRILQPGHMFGRIHVEDIAGGVMAAIARPPQGVRILNFSDDKPAESAAVTEEAARLLGVPVPPGQPLDEIWPAMSEMARSFWAEHRKVASRKTQEMLGYRWQYPTYRQGLSAILDQERRHDPG